MLAFNVATQSACGASQYSNVKKPKSARPAAAVTWTAWGACAFPRHPHRRCTEQHSRAVKASPQRRDRFETHACAKGFTCLQGEQNDSTHWMVVT